MIKWISDSPTESAYMKSSSIQTEIKRLQLTKILPIEDDFAFDSLYPVGHGNQKAKPLITVVGETSSSRGYLISTLIGFHEPIESGPCIFMAGDQDYIGSALGVELPVDMGEPEAAIATCVTRKGNPVLDHFTVVDIPFVSDGITGFFEQAQIIYVAISSDSPDFSPKLRRLLSTLRPFADKLRLVIQGTNIAPQTLGPLIWTLARCIHSSEMPQTYFMDLEESEKIKLFNELVKLPMGLLFNELELLIREAKLARAHALLMSHIKSQLPTFNRQAKQDKIADELDTVIATVSQKYMMSQNEFPSADFIREKIRTFDFGRLKKMKDSNLELINEFIERDYGRLRSMFPSDQIPIFQLTITSRSSTFPKPNFADYIDAFESLSPHNGIVQGGGALKDHLSSVSHLPSRTLYKIWKLADIDQDGGLNLKEYTICRSLIKIVQSGSEVPKQLPPSYLGL